jgi:hypothetical protein
LASDLRGGAAVIGSVGCTAVVVPLMPLIRRWPGGQVVTIDLRPMPNRGWARRYLRIGIGDSYFDGLKMSVSQPGPQQVNGITRMDDPMIQSSIGFLVVGAFLIAMSVVLFVKRDSLAARGAERRRRLFGGTVGSSAPSGAPLIFGSIFLLLLGLFMLLGGIAGLAVG